MLYISHAEIMTPEERISNGALLIDGKRIVAVGPAEGVPCPESAQVIDAAGRYLTPGFIDLQCNGGFGEDFTYQPPTIWSVAARLPRYGVTAFLPTIISSPPDTIAHAQQVLLDGAADDYAGAIPLGLHLEGPFLNPEKRGAHNPEHLRLPDSTLAEQWAPESGVRLVTLAPELPGALDLVAALTRRGVIVSAGHSSAGYGEAVTAFDAGVRYGTHLFNAMPSLHHREPGLVAALLVDQRPVVGLIADGIHVHPAMIALAWKILGSGRITLVTDAMAALGMPPGRHRVADLEAVVDETSARLADGRLAGSILSMDTALKNLMAFTGCAIEEALPTITTVPAELLGLSAERGRLAPGMFADLVLLSPDVEVEMTIVEGQVVYQA